MPPITPKFRIEQEEDQIKIILSIPNSVRTGKLVWVIDRYDVSINCPPYLLKLTFPGLLIGEEDDEEGEMEGRRPYVDLREKDEMTLVIWKKIPGQSFEGLDMLTMLKQEPTVFKGIEEVCNDDENDTNEDQLDVPRYGFMNLFSGMFSKILNEYPETIEMENPDSLKANLRRNLRERDEDDSFDEDRFLGDYFDGMNDAIYVSATQHFQGFCGVLDQEEEDNDNDKIDEEEEGIKVFEFGSSSSSKAEKQIQFNDRERIELMEIEKRKIPVSYLDIDTSTGKTNLCTVLDILLSLAYEQRITCGEGNVESAWTIKILSPALSWLDVHDNIPDTCLSFIHRILCKPYMRRYDLAQFCIRDVQALSSQHGKVGIIKCLLHVRRVLKLHEADHVFNRLWIDPLIVWCQSSPSKYELYISRQLQLFLSSRVENPYRGVRWDVYDLIQDATNAELQQQQR